ncbi:MAG TPA: NADH-quinone oxidoreductase subunit J [Anaerolineaceae bacterium]
MFIYILIAFSILVCSFQAVRVTRMLYSALWLAGSSALVALLMYLMGAHEMAVIELSVGAGLVTVLFVFAINVTGEQGHTAPSIIPHWLAIVLVITAIFFLGWLILPAIPFATQLNIASPTQNLWQDRTLDLLLQIVLIFCGILGVLGILSQENRPSSQEKHK